jgi:hypothetical protein
MRKWRAAAALVAVAIVAAGFAGWQLRGSAAAHPAHRQLSQSGALPLLRRTLSAPRQLIVPGGGACFVSATVCSESPCVEFARNVPTRPPGGLPGGRTCQGHAARPRVLRVAVAR